MTSSRLYKYSFCLCFLSIFLICISWVCLSANADEKDSLLGQEVTLILSTDDAASAAGNVLVKAKLKNATNHTITYSSGALLQDFQLAVKDADGQLLSLTNYGQALAKNAIFFNRIAQLASGQEVTVILPASRIYDMTKKDVYQISAKCTVYSRAELKENQVREDEKINSMVVTSNVVRAKVIPQPLGPIETKSQEINSTSNEMPMNKIPPSEQWRMGDSWKVVVDIFKGNTPLTKNEPFVFSNKSKLEILKPVQIIDTYTMVIKVESVKTAGDLERIELLFTPEENAPSYVKGSVFRCAINGKTKEILEASIVGKTNSPLKTLSGRPVVVFPINGYPVGFPVDFIPQPSVDKAAAESKVNAVVPADFVSNNGDFLLSVSRDSGDEDDAIVLQETLSVRNQDWFRVTQSWMPGEKWWSHYVKEDFDTQVGMKAFIVGGTDLRWSSPTQNLQLGIGSLDGVAPGGAPLKLRVALQNNSDNELPLSSLLFQKNLKLAVSGPDQQKAKLTALGQTFSENLTAFSTKTILLPHHFLFRDIVISDLYDMSLPGKYTVALSFEHSLPQQGEVTTPDFELMVTEN